jgi:hypothetical protein
VGLKAQQRVSDLANARITDEEKLEEIVIFTRMHDWRMGEGRE